MNPENQVTFKIVMEYTTKVCPIKEENETIKDRINTELEYLQTQREDLYSALDSSELISVSIKEEE